MYISWGLRDYALAEVCTNPGAYNFSKLHLLSVLVNSVHDPAGDCTGVKCVYEYT